MAFLMFLLLQILRFLLSSFLLGALAKTHYHDFVVAPTTYTRLCVTKDILTVNGQFPGPTLYVHKGDTVIINAYNQGPYNVTLHWHGLKQPRNPWSDGPEYITMCGVQPKANFTYTLIFSVEEGTIWYHAHSDWTRATVHGAIVIYPREGTTYPFPKPYKEYTVVIAEWWKADVMAVLQQGLQTGGEFNLSDAYTINGQPGDLYPCSKPGTVRFQFEYGKTYLFRVVAAGMNNGHLLGIANHTLVLVGRDGAYLKPLRTKYFMIGPGQTADILVKANQPPNLYYMAASPYSDANGVAFDNTTSTAIVEYHGYNPSTASPQLPELPLFNDTIAVNNVARRQRSLADKNHPIDVPMEIDTKLEFTVSVNELPCEQATCLGPNGTRLSASMNNISFVTPTIDILEAYYYKIKNVYTTDFPDFPPYYFNFTADSFPNDLLVPTRGTKVKVLEYNETVDLVLQGTNLVAGENHPIHLHGYSFYVLARGFGNFDPEKDPLQYNLVDPPELNTVGLPKNGWAVLRFRASNPGVWMMHCHFDRHLSWGMVAVFIVKNGPTADTSLLPPPPYMPPSLPCAGIHASIVVYSRMAFRKLLLLQILGFLLSSSLLGALAKTHYHDFVVAPTSYTRLCETKDILTVNGQFPGPTLYVHKGDTVIINVYNQAPYNVTLHWHGLKQPRNPWSDGPEYITMCGIQPKANFTYTLIFSTEEGTIWYHAHSDWTRATVHGAIVIYPREGTTYPFPKPHKEYTVVIGEWWKADVMAVMQQAMQTGADFNLSDAYTINGQPGDLYPCSKPGTVRFPFEYGKTYLFRVIGSAMSNGHFFGIANHTLVLVGRDGAYLKPLRTKYFMIGPGQTADILVKANRPPNLYYMAASPYSAAEGVAFDNTTATAIVEYEGYNHSTTSPQLPDLPLFNDTIAVNNVARRQRSLADKNHPINVPMKIDTKLEITVSVNELPCNNGTCLGPNGTRLSASMNNISFVTPTIDVLQAYYNKIKNVYTTDFPDFPPYYFNFTADSFPNDILIPTLGTKVKVLEYNETVELVLQGTNLLAGEDHPIHLHGYSFYVLARGFGNFDPEKDPLQYNLVDPPKLNTVGLPKNGWAVVRFRANNPGVWLMHCHLDRHYSWGMIAVFIVKNGPTANTSLLPPPPYMPPC
ncbi:uncharacterized protein LOC116259570 [Nymphaea colorata]|nr:uncharacterized protein LOC116259570 [Nymphaea colorata]